MKYKGMLVLHIEMCCGRWPQFHDDRGLHGDKNQFYSWDWTINFKPKTKIDKLTLYDEEDNLIYTGSWTYDEKESTKDNRFLITPKEIDFKTWQDLLVKGVKAELETDEVLEALKDKETKCKDCNTPTKPGKHSARCDKCWDTKSGD